MKSPENASPIFTETQWLGRRWWWLGGGVALLAVGVGAGATPVGASWVQQLLPLALGAMVAATFFLMRLETRIDAAGIHYRYIPFLNRWRHWSWPELRLVFSRTYSPLGDFGGWGIRGFPGNLAYNVWGPHGLQLVFKSGDRLLLGTQRPVELAAVLEQMNHFIPSGATD